MLESQDASSLVCARCGGNDDNYITSSYLFDYEKPFISLKLPFFEQNELKSKDFIKKLDKFTNGNFRLPISWKNINKKSVSSPYDILLRM